MAGFNFDEHTRFENVPVAIRAGTAKHPGAIADLLFYRNELGDAAVECGDPSMLILRDNRPAAKGRRAEQGPLFQKLSRTFPAGNVSKAKNPTHTTRVSPGSGVGTNSVERNMT